MNNTLEGSNSKITEAQEWVSDLEDRMVEVTVAEQNIEKKNEKEWRQPKRPLLLLLLSHFSRIRLCTTHRKQPTRLPHPWDSPGKNTGVGCHFLLQCMKVKSEGEVAQLCLTLNDPMDCKPSRLLCPWDFPGKSTGVGWHCLLQGFQKEKRRKKDLRKYLKR